MKSYRRHQAWAKEDGAHFITCTTHERVPWFENNTYCQIVADQLSFYARHYNVTLLAYVIMPDHVHLLIYPEGEKTFMDYMRGVKSYSAKLILEQKCVRVSNIGLGQGTPPIGVYPAHHVSKQKHKVWQPEFFDYLIFKSEKLEEKLEYIIQNPVEDGLVQKSDDYKWLFVDHEKIDQLLH